MGVALIIREMEGGKVMEMKLKFQSPIKQILEICRWPSLFKGPWMKLLNDPSFSHLSCQKERPLLLPISHLEPLSQISSFFYCFPSPGLGIFPSIKGINIFQTQNYSLFGVLCYVFK